jgi:hypothetical protein
MQSKLPPNSGKTGLLDPAVLVLAVLVLAVLDPATPDLAVSDPAANRSPISASVSAGEDVLGLPEPEGLCNRRGGERLSRARICRR